MEVNAIVIDTPRLTVHALEAGPADGELVLFIHGNASSAVFWKELMGRLPAGYRAVAPDLRGYGHTEDRVIDATRGLGDFVDDLLAFLGALGVHGRYHVIGHSLGGSVAMQLVAADSARIRTATLVNPGSPFGFGGTKDVAGTPCWPDDFAGSGGGVVNPQFAHYIAAGYRGADDPVAAPRVVMNTFYWKPPFVPAQEEELLDGLLSERVGPERYPGDFGPSEHYPFVAPGVYGPANALSPKYLGDSVERLIQAVDKPPFLWIRGADDQIVSDRSLFCFGTLGLLGVVPNYPGEAVYPPQPMVSQTRHVLDRYASQGGRYREVVMENTGHSPYIEQPAAFLELWLATLAAEHPTQNYQSKIT